ncbi:MAG: hypothetical protein KKD38_03170 [Candidatus Delongbacteria bacterium]|nr:hypothetical protein [Candidatus Delongbacteria bacterium]MCG2761551.1 hypothetical protein [Candidatus Delongbacteria bacterium]
MKFLETTKNNGSYEEINFFSLEDKYISDFNELVEIIINTFLVITAIDGSVDDYLKKALETQNANFEFIHEVCLLYPESTNRFIKYIGNIPECAFFCCKEKPSEENIRKLTSGYVEGFSSLSKNKNLLKGIYTDMKTLNSSLYISQGDCNLFIGFKK